MRCRDEPGRPAYPRDGAGRDRLAADWAAAEGWNPGLADAACFATVDAGGFLIGELDGAPAATISCVNYDARLRVSRLLHRAAGSARARLRPAHLERRRSRMRGAHHRPRRRCGAAGELQEVGVPAGLCQCPLRRPRCLPAPRRPGSSRSRTCRSRAWRRTMPRFSRRRVRRSCARGSTAPGHIGRALVRDGRLAAWGVIRPCRSGLEDRPAGGRRPRRGGGGVRGAGLGRAAAARSFSTCRSSTARRSRSRRGHGLAPVFETARMYTGAIRAVRLERVFGVTTFELG